MCRRAPGSDNTVFYCCQDHFDLEKDVVNNVEHKLTGRPLKLKLGVLPHIFDCQIDRRPAHSAPERPLLSKKRKREVLNSCLRDDVIEDSEETEDLNKSVQANLRHAGPTVGTQTTTDFSEMGIQCSLIIDMQDLMIENIKDELEFDECESDSDYEIPEEDPNDDEYISDEKVYIESNVENFIERNPKGYIGVPKDQFHLVAFWAKELKVSVRNIYLTLMKIKTNDPFFRIGDAFKISKQRAGVIFLKTLLLLAACLKQLIFAPKKVNKMCLPLAFRANYSNVSNIIDCFEVEIEKPSDPIKQALTWSEYKKANTLKYLVACTPNGCVTFVSEGCGGRTTDKMIVESSGFLEQVPACTQIMADRGFKHIEPLLVMIDCQLVRPPSLESNSQFTAEEVREGKRIASVRIHVERLIRRFREFNMIRPHACINSSLIQHMDSIVNICAGLINLQDDLIKI